MTATTQPPLPTVRDINAAIRRQEDRGGLPILAAFRGHDGAARITGARTRYGRLEVRVLANARWTADVTAVYNV